MAVIPTQLNSPVEPKVWDGQGRFVRRRAIFWQNRVLALADNDILAITGAGRMGLSCRAITNSRPRACGKFLVKGRSCHSRAWNIESLLAK